MKTLFDLLREKWPKGVKRLQSESEKTACILIAKEAVVPLAEFLTRELQMRFVFLFASDERGAKGCFHLHYVFSLHHQDRFLVLVSEVKENEPEFPSITLFLAQADWQEREVQDLFGLRPAGHPDPRRLVLHEDWPEGLYPLRKDFVRSKPVPRVRGDYAFDRVEGEGVFEIPVGPVHAGVIEPGHFRFSSAGESILKLEIRHFWKHKGIEKLGEGNSPEHLILLAERISGDNSSAHAVACAQALELLSGTLVPGRARFLRAIFLELERIYNHLGDISGIALDVAFAFGAAQLTRLRERLFRLNERLTGSRFLRSAVCPGGVRRDLDGFNKEFLLREIREIKKDFDETIQIFWQVGSLIDRIENTGIIKQEIAEALGGTGPVARASGIDRDLRRDHPYSAYGELLFIVPVFTKGDVECRMRVKIQEVYESFKIIHEAVELLPEGPITVPIPLLRPDQEALGYVESPRGECFHWIATDSKGRVGRWKIQSPSFANWPLIQYAVLENIVPDFPLINKSMNLSYSGNDR